MANKVWRDAKGMLFHDACFEEGETRDGYIQVKLDELSDDDECMACDGVFLSGLTPLDVDDEENGNGDAAP